MWQQKRQRTTLYRFELYGFVSRGGDDVAAAGLGLPLVQIFIFRREQVGHNRCDHTAVGDDTGVLPDLGKRLQNTLLHLIAAFAVGGDVGIVITGKPGLVGRGVFQHFIAMHFKIPEVDIPESGVGCKGHIAKEDLQGLVGATHTTGEESDILDVVIKFT